MFVVRGGGPNLLDCDWLKAFQVRVQLTNNIAVNDKINKLIQSNNELFSDKLGKYKYSKIHVDLKENYKATFCKFRPVPLAYRDLVDQEIDAMIKEGVLERTKNSNWGTPLVPVLKENGSIRLCGDYKRTLNNSLEDVIYPLPRIEEVLTKLNKGEYFSKIDIRSAYNQIEVDEETSEILTWNTHLGLFRHKRLPFGIKTATAIFQRIMDQLIQGIDGVCSFLDDLIVTGVTTEKHLENLEMVFKRLSDAGFTLRKEKCSFFQREVNYLGHRISKEGIKKTNDKIKAIVEAPIPKNVSEVRSFAGMVNYYSKFIPNLSTLLHPIYNLLKNNTKFQWSKNCDLAFKKIKEIISSDDVLMHFDYKLPIIVTCDASNVGISGVLSQIKDGQERTVTCVSRTLSDCEKRTMATVEKEALAIYYTVKRLYQYLCGVKFILRTDCKCLVALFGENKEIPQMSANRLQRWAAFLSMFNYQIQYIKGAQNQLADYFSRNPVACTQNFEDRGLFINFTESQEKWPIDNAEVRKETEKDPELTGLIKNIKNNKWPKNIDKKIMP